MADRALPTKEEVDSYLRDRRNWGRWGKDDDKGAINLITPEKRVAAARLVRSGRAVSLSRFLPTDPAPNNPTPAKHWMRVNDRSPGYGSAVDFYGVAYHGTSTTHLDALCHVWDSDGMYNGRDPAEVIGFAGAKFGSVEKWSEGIITRGVFMDIPKYRGQPYVTQDKPVHGWELEEVAKAEGVAIESGDAWWSTAGVKPTTWTTPTFPGAPSTSGPGSTRPASPSFTTTTWPSYHGDMMDHSPNDYGIPWSVHPVIFAYGVALQDNALLEPLAQACAEEGRYEFMLSILPLRVAGGTGSPVNPVALF